MYKTLVAFSIATARLLVVVESPALHIRKYSTLDKKTKTWMSYQITTEQKCTGCNEAILPLRACTSFLGLSNKEQQAIVRRQGPCMNCLRHWNFTNQCQSLQDVRNVQASKSAIADLSKTMPVEKVSNKFLDGNRGGVLLMTCQIIIQGPNNSTAKARASLVPGSEASFIIERLAQQLGLSLRRGSMITCIAETTPHVQCMTKGSCQHKGHRCASNRQDSFCSGPCVV